MIMKPPILTAATLIALSAGLLPAADSQLLNLVMPDAKVLAGVNVDAAKGTPFGQYVLSQIQAQGDPHLQQVATLTGFDPTRDVHELLVASSAVPGSQNGLILARGTFNASAIQAAAQLAGGVLETYKGVTLIKDPKQTHAFAFPDSTTAIAGDVASVKGAIDRQTLAAPLPAAVIVQVNQWSGAQDAWVIADVPPATLHAPVNPGTQNPALQNAFQNIQQTAGGVKFGAQVVLTGQAQADTAQNATAMAGVVQFLVSMAQLQTQQKNPQLAALLPALSVTASANFVNISLSVPEAQVEQIVKPKPAATPQSLRKGPARRL